MQERGFLSLSTALLSSSILRSEGGRVMEIFMDVASSVEAVILSFLFCRSGWRESTHAPSLLDLLLKLAKEIYIILIHFPPNIVGLIFLFQDPELSSTLIHALRGGHRGNKEDSIPLRYASVLISKGFFCSQLEIGMIIGTHLKMVGSAYK